MYTYHKNNWVWNLGNEMDLGEIWSSGKINLSPGKVLEKSLKFVSENGYEPCTGWSIDVMSLWNKVYTVLCDITFFQR